MLLRGRPPGCSTLHHGLVLKKAPMYKLKLKRKKSTFLRFFGYSAIGTPKRLKSICFNVALDSAKSELQFDMTGTLNPFFFIINIQK